MLISCVGGRTDSGSGTAKPRTTSSGWLVTVYYTAVESYHHGVMQSVTGCRKLQCDNGNSQLGDYPADFVRAVHDEGAGLIISGQHAREYLNWSSGVGYWLDTAPRDSAGRPLRPFVSAAADRLADGTPVRLINCGRQDDGSAVPADVCHRLSTSDWQIRDRFTQGLGGSKHIDCYLGQESAADFTDQPIYTTLVGATLSIG